MSIAPDGSYLYLSSLEKDHWNVVAAKDGTFLAKINPETRSHNTIVGRNGMNTYLAGLRSEACETLSNTFSVYIHHSTMQLPSMRNTKLGPSA